MGQMHHISEEDMVLLTALLDGALDPHQADTVRQRLATDDSFNDAYLDLLVMRDELVHLPAVRMPRSLRLDQATFARARGWRWWFILPPGGVLTPTLSAVASLVVVVFFVQELMGVVAPADMNASMMAAPMMLEPAPVSEDAALMADSAPMVAESAPISEDAASMADSVPMVAESAPVNEEMVLTESAPEAKQAAAEVMPLDDMGYQHYGAVWFNWAIAGIVVSALLLATSLRWLIQVWWRQRHQRS